MKKWYGQIYSSDFMLCDCVSDYHFFLSNYLIGWNYRFQNEWELSIAWYQLVYLIPKYNKRTFGEFIIFEIK